MTDPTNIQNVADVLRENRDQLSHALFLFGDRDDPGYEDDLIHVQALDQAADLLEALADFTEDYPWPFPGAA